MSYHHLTRQVILMILHNSKSFRSPHLVILNLKSQSLETVIFKRNSCPSLHGVLHFYSYSEVRAGPMTEEWVSGC